MTKSELFKAAHKLAKATIQAGDNYRVTFGLAIKAILSQTTNSIVDTLLAVGLKVWENYGKKTHLYERRYVQRSYWLLLEIKRQFKQILL